MANIFLSAEHRDVETAILLEQAIIHDIGNDIAYTDGKQTYINTEENLSKILPAYGPGMLKWLLWHEKLHNELRHHPRYYNFSHDYAHGKYTNLSYHEVNIIMDILVHDSLSKWFPELVPIAKLNMAQMRDSNSLKYTFTTDTLEEMLEEYSNSKGTDDPSKGGSSEKTDEEEDTSEDTSEDTPSESSEPSEHSKEDESSESSEHSKDTSTTSHETPSEEETSASHHDDRDWGKLKDIGQHEFLSKSEVSDIQKSIRRLKTMKLRLATLAETLNGLATSTRKRTYTMPSPIKLNGNAILKGRVPSKSRVHLCFDASGSMGGELQLFKELIEQSLPQSMNMPCTWFAGDNAPIPSSKTVTDTANCTDKYYKGTFKDLTPVRASNGFSDDGDRTIELCLEAEEQGYSPIGVTDGGGRLSWSTPKLKQLKRTIIISPSKEWLDKVTTVNPHIKTLYLERDD